MVGMKTITKVCAIYTRKSTDERLDMEFNTLDAQREACEAYILSQKSEGWAASKDSYDDGGFSGGSLERPALMLLIDDIKAGKIQTVVVYKIDRLTRSLTDFSKLVEVFDAHDVTFVSVTQSFNTTTSMGRLTLNVLLSFAQFEREVSGERIRDKIAASKAKGMWQGGKAPFGFNIGDRRLIVNDEDAPIAKQIFELYLKLGQVRELTNELKRLKIKSRERISQTGLKYGGHYFSRGALYSMLTNPVYIGKIRHIDKIHEGMHDAIISQDLWDKVQKRLQEKSAYDRGEERQAHKNLLTGLIFDENGNPYTPVFTNKPNGKRYRYYCNDILANNKAHPDYSRARFPAHEIEATIESTIRQNLPKWINEIEESTGKYFIEHQAAISSYEFVRRLLTKAIVHHDKLILHITLKPLSKIAHEHLNIHLTCDRDEVVMDMPYQLHRAQAGSQIIKSEGRDIFDMPPNALKKFVQGTIWRDEHFDGMPLAKIARREGCSRDYVSSAIYSSLKIIQSA